MVFGFQVFAASLHYDRNGAEYAFAFTLALFSLCLATVAIILLLIGI